MIELDAELKKKETANRIKLTREQSGLTQEAMAEKAGLMLDNYKKIEDGSNAMSIVSLRKVQQALGVSFDFLLEGTQTSVNEILKQINACSKEERIFLFMKMISFITNTEYSEKELYQLMTQQE